MRIAFTHKAALRLLLALAICLALVATFGVSWASATHASFDSSVAPSNLSLTLLSGSCHKITVSVNPPAELENNDYISDQLYKIVPAQLPGGFPPGTVTVDFSPIAGDDTFWGHQTGEVEILFRERICALSGAPPGVYEADYAFEIKRVLQGGELGDFDNAGKQHISIKVLEPANVMRIDLIAGGGNPKSAIDAGDVFVYNDAQNLYVGYLPADGWCLVETHLHIASGDETFPVSGGKGKGNGKANKPHNPIPGQFEYAREYDGCVPQDLYVVSLKEEGAALGNEVGIAAHAVVNSEWGQETAWADGTRFTEKGNWATYFTYTIEEIQPPPPPRGNTLITNTTYALGLITIEVDSNGDQVWKYESEGKPYDVERLPNGNTLIADFGRATAPGEPEVPAKVVEVEPDGDIAWETDFPQPFDVEVLPNGNLLVVSYYAYRGRIWEIEPQDPDSYDVVWDTGSWDTDRWGAEDNRYLRDVEILEGDKLLIVLEIPGGEGQVIEVNKSDGTILWEKTGMNGPFDAERLPNGNTLIADTGNGRIIEVDGDGDEVWVYSAGLISPVDVEMLDSGNILIVDRYADCVIEIDRTTKEIVWEYDKPVWHPYDAERL